MSEKSKKKAYFIKKTIKALGLKNAEVIDTAITPSTKNLELFDTITARALAPSNDHSKNVHTAFNPKWNFFTYEGQKRNHNK